MAECEGLNLVHLVLTMCKQTYKYEHNPCPKSQGKQLLHTKGENAAVNTKSRTRFSAQYKSYLPTNAFTPITSKKQYNKNVGLQK